MRASHHQRYVFGEVVEKGLCFAKKEGQVVLSARRNPAGRHFIEHACLLWISVKSAIPIELEQFDAGSVHWELAGGQYVDRGQPRHGSL